MSREPRASCQPCPSLGLSKILSPVDTLNIPVSSHPAELCTSDSVTDGLRLCLAFSVGLDTRCSKEAWEAAGRWLGDGRARLNGG